MKKIRKAIIYILLITQLSACNFAKEIPGTSGADSSIDSSVKSPSESSAAGTTEQSSEADQHLKVSMGVKKFTDTEIEVKISNNETEELIYGEAYHLERYDNGIWNKVNPSAKEVMFTDIGYVIKPNESSFWSTDYTLIYDSLPAGEYRILKAVSINSVEHNIAGTFTVSEK